jgi:hypothetical protein
MVKSTKVLKPVKPTTTDRMLPPMIGEFRT